jgi:hypothetical protein
LLVLIKREKQKWSTIVLLYFLYSVVSDLFLDQISKKFFQTEIVSFRIFTIVEFISFSIIFYKINYSIRTKRTILLSSSLFFLSIIIDLLTNSIENFDSLPTGVESILILFYCILTLYEQISTGKPLYSFPVLFAFSLILFFSGTFFLFIMSQNNFENEEFSTLYDYIVAISKILMTLLMSVGILANRRTETHNNRTFQKI